MDLPLALLPGESAYSLVARFHMMSPYNCVKHTNQILFGRELIRVNPFLPGHIDNLARLSGIHRAAFSVTASAHTIVAFGLKHRAKRNGLFEAEITDNGSEIYEKGRIAASKLSFGHMLKSCPACIAEDEMKFGVPYWHVVHQLHGVTVCPVHNVLLHQTLAGDGELNHRYVLPDIEVNSILKGFESSYKLSKYVAELFMFLQQQTPVGSLSERYKAWLSLKGYLTAGGRIRWKTLKKDLKRYWAGLFGFKQGQVPPELGDFSFVPRLVHHDTSTHYVRDVLLMGFLTDSPVEFFNIPLKSEANKILPPSESRNKVSDVVKLLNTGLSLREIGRRLECSIGFVKGLAIRNGISIDRRRQFITVDIERAVWRKAFIGQHRSDISESLGISVGAVEQIIQSHSGLSKWRRHLKMHHKMHLNRTLLRRFMESNGNATRNEIKRQCSAYMWLYKNDKDWLYAQLPKAQVTGHRPEINWPMRDLMLCNKIDALNGTFLSISAVDRAVDGHNWLLNYSKKLPKSFEKAKALVAVWK